MRKFVALIAGVFRCCLAGAFVLGAVAEDTPEAVPVFDDPRHPFRRAPMELASRSLWVPLGHDVHAAYDTRSMRLHTVWKGRGLALFGPPYSGTKSPFICVAEGERLFGNPPVGPWFLGGADGGRSPESGLPGAVLAVVFDGVLESDDQVWLRYRVSAPDEESVLVWESMRSSSPEAIGRTVSVGPSDHPLAFLDRSGVSDGSASFLTVKVCDDRLGSYLSMRSLRDPKSYRQELFTEERSEVAALFGTYPGPESRRYVFIAPRKETLVFEVIEERLAPGSPTEETEAPKPPEARRVDPVRFSANPEDATPVHGTESYAIQRFPAPPEVGFLVGGMDWLSNGDLVVAGWASGDVYVVEETGGPVERATYRLIARGLNEPLGVATRGDRIFVAQKGELTELVDSNGDGYRDFQKCVTQGWGYTGNYHAYAFGPVFDGGDDPLVFLTGQRGRWDVPFVGWAARVNLATGDLTGWARGLRVPNGVGVFGPRRDVFVADNQGNWIGACRLNHVREGLFYGFPSGRPAPESEYRNPPNPAPPAVWLPRELSRSASGFAEITDERFGPFQGQMIVGDFQRGVLLRVALERVGGAWQGSVCGFLDGFEGAINRVSYGPDGRLYVGGCKRTWSTPAPREDALERVGFTGVVPFEILSVKAAPDGFRVSFTRPVNRARASDPENYVVSQFRYEYHREYGSAEFDHQGAKGARTELAVREAAVSEDRLSVDVTVPGLKEGFVTEIRPYALVDDERRRLGNDTMFYTLNKIPARD